MVACDVNEPRASTHSALPPEQPHAVCLANFAYDTPYDAQRVTCFNAPISQNSRHDMSDCYDPRVVPHPVYPDQFSHLRQGPQPPRSLDQRVPESARNQAYVFAGPTPQPYSTSEPYDFVNNYYDQYDKHSFIADKTRAMTKTSTDHPYAYGQYDVPNHFSGQPFTNAESRVINGGREPRSHGNTITSYGAPHNASDIYMNGARFPDYGSHHAHEPSRALPTAFNTYASTSPASTDNAARAPPHRPRSRST